MLEKKQIGVAVPKNYCFICAKLVDQDVIMNTKATKSAADKVKALHGAVVGFMEEPCNECKEQMKKGVIIVTMNSDKTDDPNNPYRTGGFFLVTEDYIGRLLEEKEHKELKETVLTKRYMFLEHVVAEKLGFFNFEDKKDGNK